MDREELRILFTGDFCPVNRIEELGKIGNYDAVFNDVISELSGNDLNVIDLECPLTTSRAARHKSGPHQKASPDCIQLLKFAGFGLAALSNNHILDYGVEGVQNTLELCQGNGITTVGIGNSSEASRKPFSTVLKGRRIAVLNIADNEFLSLPDGSYFCNPIDPVNCFYDVKEAKKDHDFIIVVAHAGNEFYEFPSPRTKKLFRYLIDIGANAVISHHTHAFSGYEIYNSSPIFYGLGNFLYDWPGKVNTGWNRGYMVRLRILDEIDFDIIPIKQCNIEPGVFLLNKTEEKQFLIDLDRLSSVIADDKRLDAEFREYCRKVYPMYDAFIEPNFGKYITALRKRGLFPRLNRRRKRLFLLNIIRCESHRDVLMRLLKKNE